MNEQDTDRDPLDLVAEEFAERCRLGESPSVSDYAAKYPAYANELRELLPPVAMMEQLRRRRQSDRLASILDEPLDRLGDFRILREVGRGGMGVVYEAEQESLGRRVAIKVLPRVSRMDATRLQRFRREAQAAAMLHHGQIVPIFGVGEHEGSHFYVMQFIDGHGLDELLYNWRHQAKTGAAPSASEEDARIRQIARLGAQVADALDYAHAQGVLHRDIKPANLLLDAQGAIWITDFGLAKLVESDDLTKTGDVIGTLQYLPPEGLRGRADARGDIYSLGLTLCELLTLKPPFPETDPSALLRRVAEGSPDRPRLLAPSIPKDLETIILKASAHEPERRYATAGALAEDLRRFLDDRPILARRSGATELLWRWCRRNQAKAALGASLAASLVVAVCLGIVALANSARALEENTKRLREVEIEKRRAEANAQLSMDALEDIFNTLAHRDEQRPSPDDDFGGRGGPPPPPDGFGGPPGRPPHPANRRPPPPGPGRRERPPEVTGEEAALLRSVLTFYDRFAATNTTNPRLQIEAAKAHRRTAALYQRLRRSDDAEAAIAKAVTLSEALVAKFPQEPRYREELAQTYGLTDPWADTDEATQRAANQLRKAVAIEQMLVKDYPKERDYLRLLAHDSGRLAELEVGLGQTAEAESIYQQVISRLTPAEMDLPGRIELSTAQIRLATIWLEQGKVDAARPLVEQAAEVLGSFEPPPPREGRPPIKFDDLYRSLAEAFESLGDSTRAEQWLAQSRHFGERRPPPPFGGFFGGPPRREPPPPR